MRNPSNPQSRLAYVVVSSLVFFLCLTGLLPAADQQQATYTGNRSLIDQAVQQIKNDAAPDGIALERDNKGLYACNMKIYVVEPTSRYRDQQGHNYEFGFLDFAYDTSLNLEYQVPFSRTIEWDPAQHGVGTIQSSNIKVIAVIYNHLQGYLTYQIPPDSLPFTAYYADATAAALPGEVGYNEAAGGYSHTVFIEEGTSPT